MARARLPLPMITTRVRQAGEIVADGAATWWHWQGRQVRLVDGATVSLADTQENQAAYPQSSSQKAGLGFPMCRLVALLRSMLDTPHGQHSGTHTAVDGGDHAHEMVPPAFNMIE